MIDQMTQKRLILIMKTSQLDALHDLVTRSPDGTLGGVTGDHIKATAETYQKEWDALGTDGLMTEDEREALFAKPVAPAPSIPQPQAPAIPTVPTGQAPAANPKNPDNQPDKLCPKCDGVYMKYDISVPGYRCDIHGENPQPGLFTRILKGTTDTTKTVAEATTDLTQVAVQTGGNMAQAHTQVTTLPAQIAAQAAAPPIPPAGAAAAPPCPTCTGPSQVHPTDPSYYFCPKDSTLIRADGTKVV